jgi:hypothetical protein
MLVSLLGFITWTQMHARIIESYPKLTPEVLLEVQEERMSPGINGTP